MTPYQLKINGAACKPQPTDEERKALEAYGEARWAEKLGKELKEQVIEIVQRLGEVSIERGLLAPSESKTYPLPTLPQWHERVAQKKQAHQQVLGLAAQLRASGKESEAGDVEAGAEDMAAEIGQMEKLGDELATVLRWQEIISEWKDYFIASGVVTPQVTKTVKYFAIRRLSVQGEPVEPPTAPKKH